MTDRVLVTGGAGFIGSNICHILEGNGYDVVVLDSFDWGHIENIENMDVEIERADIRDADIVDDLVQSVDGVFHLAAHVGNRRSINDPIVDAEINVTGTLNLLESAKRHEVSKFVYSSSAAIFGEVEYTPLDESHPVEPDSPYGVTKLAGEKHCLCYSRLHDIDVVCLRYFNVYGINQRYDEYGNVIPIWTKRLLDREPLIIYGDGEQTRDFIDVRDVARANLLAYESPEANGPINIGTGEATKIKNLAQIFVDIADRDVEVRYEPPRKGEVRHSVADVSKAENQLGFEPEISLNDGVEDYVSWLVSIWE